MLVLGGPGLNYQIDPDADWFLLIGDDAALPAIETILEELPDHRTPHHPTTRAAAYSFWEAVCY